MKPELDQRDGAKFVASRMGLSHTCIYFSELQAMPEEKVRGYACVIVDEAHFLSRDEVQYLVGVVDDWNVPLSATACGPTSPDSSSRLPGAAGGGRHHRGGQDHLLVRQKGHLQRPFRQRTGKVLREERAGGAGRQ